MTGHSFVGSVLLQGFAIVPGVVSAAEIEHLASGVDALACSASARRGGEVYAIRHLLDVPAIRALANTPAIRGLIDPVLGTAALPVRGLFFDKTAPANWKVPWHQDRTLAVARRVDLAGFGPWSTKAGIVHVEPPVEILERMLTLRLHLDDCDEANGPLRVIPGSQALGRLTAVEIRRRRESAPSIACLVPAGGVVLMRPLLLHASSAARSPRRRRVIHLEFAAGVLPPGLNWAVDACVLVA